MKMGKKELAKWSHFGDIHAMGKSVPQGWFGTLLLSKWMRAGLVRTVRFWEDSVEISAGTIREWTIGEIIAPEKGLEIL